MSLNEHDDGTPILSVAAFQLHGFAILHSVKDGTPGFVSDDYLNAVAAETTVTVAELRVIVGAGRRAADSEWPRMCSL